MHRPTLIRAAVVFGALATATTVYAQSTRASQFLDNCDRNGGRDETFCETRAVTLPLSAALRVDGRQNGGITVHGWDNANFQVVAMVQARAATKAEAQSIARAINITATSGDIRSDGPDMDGDNHRSWSVSYEVWAPRGTALTLNAMNGGIGVDGVHAQMNLETMNGGISLSDVDGAISAHTMNGGITAELRGTRSTGGLDLRTTNGGIKLTLPASFSAHLETSTVNGSLDLGIPVTVEGRLSRSISADLGAGGPTIRAVTTNGGVSIVRR